MKTKTDLYLSYQKESGMNLSTIKTYATGEYHLPEITCPECNKRFFAEFGEFDTEHNAYVDWLENLLLMIANAGRIEL